MKPITLDTQARVISFWSKLISDEDHKLSTLIYKIAYEMHKTHKIKSAYIDNVQRIINSCGFSGIRQSQSLPNPKWFNLAISQKLHDQFIQNWSSLVQTSSSGVNYRLFKDSFGCSDYVNLLSNYHSKSLLAFRTRNRRLPVELGRWNGTPLNKRICHLCQKDIRGEYCRIFLTLKFKGRGIC